MQPMNFEAHKGSDSQANMISLGNLQPILGALHPGELFETPMIDFDLPGIQSIEGRLFQGHGELAGGPVFRVAICADRPKDFDPTIPLEMYPAPVPRNENVPDGPIAGAVNADFAIGLELGEPFPLLAAQQLQVGQPTVPTVEHHQLRRKVAGLGLLHHVLKVVVLGQAILRLVVQTKITRQPTGCFGSRPARPN